MKNAIKNRVNTASSSATEGLNSEILHVPESPSPPTQVPTSIGLHEDFLNLQCYMATSDLLIFFFFFFGYFLSLVCGRTLLTLSAQKTKTDTFENSVDPDETAHNELSQQDLHYLPFCSSFTTVIVLATTDLLKY